MVRGGETSNQLLLSVSDMNPEILLSGRVVEVKQRFAWHLFSQTNTCDIDMGFYLSNKYCGGLLGSILYHTPSPVIVIISFFLSVLFIYISVVLQFKLHSSEASNPGSTHVQ